MTIPYISLTEWMTNPAGRSVRLGGRPVLRVLTGRKPGRVDVVTRLDPESWGRGREYTYRNINPAVLVVVDQEASHA